MAAFNSVLRAMLRRIRGGMIKAHEDRASPRCKIPVFVPFGARGPLVERRANLGIGGFCFEGESEYPKGTAVEIAFRLPDVPDYIRVRGEVLGQVWRDGFRGVRGRFVELPFEVERALARWLDMQTLRPAGHG